MDEIAPKVERSRPRKSVGAILLILGLIVGVAGGVVFQEPLSDLFHGHHHEHANAAGSGEAKQLWTCGMHPQVIQDKPGLCPICNMALEPLKAGAAADVNSSKAIHIDPVVVQNMGVRVAKVAKGPLAQSARVVGVLREADPNIRDVNLRVSGWIEKLHANTEGMHLNKGDPLFDLYSPDVRVAIQELSTARRSLAALQNGADAATRQSAEAFLAASREKLLLWGIEADEIDRLAAAEKAPRTVTFRSPIGGHLIEKGLVEGAMVKSGERALRIVDHSTLWLDTQVHAQDLPLVKIGQKVAAKIESQPGKTFEGEVIFVHPHIDPTTRTATVRVALPNPQMELRPGMYATARITAKVADDALLVPLEAVIDTGDRRVAFVSKPDGHFEPRELKIGAAGGDGNVQVLGGLEAGELVVTSGQFLLDSESRMREAVQKHLSEKLLKKPEPAKAQPPVIADAAFDRVVAEYLKVARKLGEVERSKEPVDVSALLGAAKGLAAGPGGASERPAVSELIASVEALGERPLDGQREAFKRVSGGVIALVDRHPPSTAVAPNLYVLYCSMEDGYWLQDTEQKANPYYATKMKKCAEVKRTVSTTARG